MPAATARLSSLLSRARGHDPRAMPWESEELLCAELFSIERMEQHAASLALAQPVSGRNVASRALSARLRDNESVLLSAYHSMGAGFQINYRYGSTRYIIAVRNPDSVCHGVVHAELDGRVLASGRPDIDLVDDGKVHRVAVILGRTTAGRATA